MSLQEGGIDIDFIYQGKTVFFLKSKYVPSVGDLISIDGNPFECVFRRWNYSTETMLDLYKKVIITVRPLSD